MPRLTAATLDQANSGVATPPYDRAGLVTGIAHFGMGGFHRAHQALMIDELLRRGEAREWAITGIGVRPEDSRMRAALGEQDGLYTLIEKHADGAQDARVIGSILGMLTLADDGAEAVLELLSTPTTRIVSLTVTEGGYNINQSTGEFLIDAPDVVADLAEGAMPRTVFGLIVEALRRRREAGTTPFTVMSCDNLPDNGRVAHRSILAFAEAKDPELAAWIDAEVAFPNSMVDRITPATTDADRRSALELTGLEDAWPVVCETFFQWVLQDSFVNGRPPYELARVELVDDVEPYEMMKLRLLNSSHQGLCYFGYLLGYRFVADATSDPLISGLLRNYIGREAIPTLRPIGGVDPAEYGETCISRFRNPQVGDTVARLCAESSDRIPKWLLPVVFDLLAEGRSVDFSAAIVASWARYARGVDEQGEPIEVVDNRREQVMAAAAPSDDPLAFIRDPELFGDLAERPEFTEPYLYALTALNERGARALLTELAERA
ncbi:mannitol dehydrogenase family protein [Leucobacter sp. CSA1]|uniref:Mannitol-1-phosphate 5-dehydrogenase n=1 Tax=Leucobacter chromiisoli TaxID=2796471 RepID=A0A934Q6K3_9MICO|nr:mannitol dehydrogenase family protein [Leucobacter chromiisoli]MBK0418363.1 mannitol dehydrogenase family protein [Leucobacter chromiisoli]